MLLIYVSHTELLYMCPHKCITRTCVLMLKTARTIFFTDRGPKEVQASKASLLSSHRVLAHVAALVKCEHRDVRTNVVQHSPLLYQ